MRNIRAAVLAAAATAATMSGAAAVERSYDVGPFHAIDIATGLNAVVTIGTGQSVRVESGHEGAFDKLDIHVEDGKLVARLESDFFDFIMGGGLLGMLINGRPDITLHITAPEIDGIAASGGADIEGGGMNGNQLTLSSSSGADITLTNVAVGSAEASVSSGADIHVAGSCDRFSASASSGATLDAGGLQCRTAEVDASSGATLRINARDAVRANASSGGDVAVLGNPAEQDFQTSSGGDVWLDD